MSSRQTILSTVIVTWKWQIENVPINNSIARNYHFSTTAVLDLHDNGFEYRHCHISEDMIAFELPAPFSSLLDSHRTDSFHLH